MDWYTHSAGGLLAGLGIYSLAPQYFGGHPQLLAVAVSSALVMDVDHPGSFVGRMVPFFPGVQRGPGGHVIPFNSDYRGKAGRVLPGGYILWHREETHSLGFALCWAVVAGLGALFWGGWRAVLPAFALALAGGLSHLALDRFNTSREYLLWPFQRGKAGHLTDWWPRLRVGGMGERLVFLGLMGLTAVLARGHAGSWLHQVHYLRG